MLVSSIKYQFINFKTLIDPTHVIFCIFKIETNLFRPVKHKNRFDLARFRSDRLIYQLLFQCLKIDHDIELIKS